MPTKAKPTQSLSNAKSSEGKALTKPSQGYSQVFSQAKPSQCVNGGGDLRETQVDVPILMR